MLLNSLQQKIDNKEAILAVVGLGYVGFPVACIFADAGFRVIGLDVKAERVATINEGIAPVEGDEPGLADLVAQVVSVRQLKATTDYSELARADIVLIAVDTPVEGDHRPRYQALIAACDSLGQVMSPGTLVIIESTVAPGTVKNVVKPALEAASGLAAGSDFHLGVCPERVMPGKLLANLRNLSRVCGGDSPETAQVMVNLYRHIVQADLDIADVVTAELVKTVENTYRDVQIAFANEVAKICQANGADVWQVRELVNKSPSRQMHLPGAGVGGHCIPKDPWLLAYSVEDKVPLHIIPSARRVNDEMPHHMAEMVVRALTEAGQIVTQARVGVLGYAYLENSADTRHSPTASMVAQLHASVGEVYIHDPWVKQYQGDLYDRFKRCHALVLMVKHDEYRNLDFARLKELMRTPLLIDGRGFFDPAEIEEAGLIYRGVGYGKDTQ